MGDLRVLAVFATVTSAMRAMRCTIGKNESGENNLYVFPFCKELDPSIPVSFFLPFQPSTILLHTSGNFECNSSSPFVSLNVSQSTYSFGEVYCCSDGL